MSIDSTKASTHSALGFTYHCQGFFERAIECYHAALSYDADDSLTTELLKRAIKEFFEADAAALLDEARSDEIVFDPTPPPQLLVSTPSQFDAGAAHASNDTHAAIAMDSPTRFTMQSQLRQSPSSPGSMAQSDTSMMMSDSE